MAQPVWVLSVDLQTKTATFQSGLADAARAARGSFNDIKTGSGEMGREVGGNMMEARHGVMLLGEEFGVHLPRALTTFIASIGPIGAAFEAAFPFLAIAVGATLLIEHLVKLHEAGEKVTEDQMKFGTALTTAYNTLDDKILQAGIRSDDLRNNHLGALTKQLELIDHQSMDELIKAFENVAKAADIVFKDLPSEWYTFGIGATGAKHALETFQAQYDSLLARGKDADAGDLLAGTLKSAKAVLALQKEAAANDAPMALNAGPGSEAQGNLKRMEAVNELRKSGVGFTEKEVTAQQTLVDALTAQVGIEGKIAELKKLESGNATLSANKAVSSEHAAAARQAAEAQLRIGEEAVQADHATATARLEIQRASIQERLASDIAFADRERDVELAGNAAQMAALDRLSKDYPNALAALKGKALEIAQQHATKITELTAKADVALYSKSLVDLEQSEREKIDATQKGTAQRLAAIDAAIKEEQSRNMQDLASYRALLTERVQTLQQMAQEEAKIRSEMGLQEAQSFLKAGEMMLSAQKQQDALANSTHLVTEQERVAQETQIADEEYAIKIVTYAKELAALDKNDKDYLNKLRELQNQEKQLTQQHENDIAAIKEKAQEQQNQSQLAAITKMEQLFAGGFAQVIMGHESFAKMMNSIGNEVVSGMLKNAMMSIMTANMDKEAKAAKAARDAYANGEAIGGPAGLVLGPVFGAAAFAAVMAFEGGGIVPGFGRGDIVPAMLSPGEAVLPKGMTDMLQNAAQRGDGGGGHHYHVVNHIKMTAHALDSDGVDEVFTKHAGKIQRHFENTLRKMNR
jgi:hypothetical protein